MPFVESLLAAMRRYREDVAVVTSAAEYTYADLDLASASLADVLAGHGVSRGDVVLVRSDRSWGRCAALPAVWRTGAAVLTVDPATPPARLRKLLSAARVRLVLDGDGVPGAGTADVAAPDVPVLDLAEQVGGLAPPGTAADRADDLDGPLAYVVATSGSTGEPKLVAVPPATLDGLGRWYLANWPHAERPDALHAASVGFDVSHQELVTTWLAGARLVVVEARRRRDPFAVAELLRRHQVVRAFLPVMTVHALAGVLAAESRALDGLRELVVAGDRLTVNQEVRQMCAAGGITLVNEYGPSETHAVTRHPLPPDAQSWPVHPPIGSAIAAAELLRLADGVVRPFADGDEDELVIAGPGLAAGYLNAPDLTRERFRHLPHADGRELRCYFTGDLVVLWDDALHFLGRVDDQLKVRGYRVEPAEVEAALGRFPGVRGVAVVGVRRAQGTQLVACYVTDGRASVDARQLRDFCAAQLPSYLVPTRFREVSGFPVSANGKLDRRRLSADLTP